MNVRRNCLDHAQLGPQNDDLTVLDSLVGYQYTKILNSLTPIVKFAIGHCEALLRCITPKRIIAAHIWSHQVSCGHIGATCGHIRSVVVTVFL